MVLTAAQSNDFFITELGFPQHTRDFLIHEGLNKASDLANFAQDDHWLLTIVSCKSLPHISDPTNARNLIAQAPYHLLAVALNRVKIVACSLEYYNDTGCELMASAI